MSSQQVQRLAVVGTGLIGASAGLGARRAGVPAVTGWDPDGEALALAAERGAVEPAGDLVAALAACATMHAAKFAWVTFRA